jgi:acyl carrier protein
MDVGERQKKVDGLEAIKSKALNMAKDGKDSLEVRDFVTNAKKELAYELPDEEAFQKAKAATLAYKRQVGK